jgi:FkbM family methyltransferase
MSKLKVLARNLLFRSIAALPVAVIRRLEIASRTSLGKGWGAETVTDEVRAALSLLPPETRSSPVVLDVGANVGTYSEAFRKLAPDSTLYCFEPSKASFSDLSRRFAGDNRIHLVNAAVGDSIGIARLWSDKPGSALGSLTKRRLNHFNIDFEHQEEVPVITLDSWQSESHVFPDIIKLDVEGHELTVLRGAKKALETVQVVQFEFGGCNIDTRTYLQDFYYFFLEAGFALFRLGPKGLHRLDHYSEIDESFSTTNFFAQRQ